MQVQKTGFLTPRSQIACGTLAVVSVGIAYGPRALKALNASYIAKELIDNAPLLMKKAVAFLHCANASNLSAALLGNEKAWGDCLYKESLLAFGIILLIVLFIDLLMKCCARPVTANTTQVQKKEQ